MKAISQGVVPSGDEYKHLHTHSHRERQTHTHTNVFRQTPDQTHTHTHSRVLDLVLFLLRILIQNGDLPSPGAERHRERKNVLTLRQLHFKREGGGDIEKIRKEERRNCLLIHSFFCIPPSPPPRGVLCGGICL